jgi:hypothetical protein
MHTIFQLGNYKKIFITESQQPMGDLARSARKMFQRLHNEGLIAQGIMMD